MRDLRDEGCNCEVVWTDALGTYDTVTDEWIPDRATVHVDLRPSGRCPFHKLKSYVVELYGLVDGKRAHWMPGNRRKGTGAREKYGHETESAARAWLIERGRGLDWSVYRCPICSKFHVASPVRK